jgi:ribosome-associated protein
LKVKAGQNTRRQTISDALAGLTPEQVKDLVRQSLDDDKGMDIVTIPLAGKSTIADYMIIATGASSRQVASMADHIEFKLKKAGIAIMGKEGMQQADWVLLDTAEVIVHIFRPEVRDFYALERMWTQPSSTDEVVHVS